MPEHFVRHHQQEVILRQVEREELSAAIEDAERQPPPAALVANFQGKPSIFCRREQVLGGNQVLRASGRRHV